MSNETKPRRDYVNNQDFLNALTEYKDMCLKYQEENKTPPPIPNYIGECFIKIAEGLSHKPNFINYPFRDEMVSDGVENCLMYFGNFDVNKSKNPFAYFTQIIYYAFIRRIQKEKKQLYIKYKATENMGVLDEQELLEMEDGTRLQFELYDNISEFIGNFEESKKSKKVTSKPKKGLDIFFAE